MNTADTVQLPDELYEVTEAPFEADEKGPYLFISYAHKSRKDVFASIRRIYEQGWRIWYDEGLTIGEDYYGALRKHMEECTVFLLYVTKASLESTFVREHEIPFAQELGKPIVVCFLDESLSLDLGGGAVYTGDAGLEDALSRIAALKRGEPRAAVGHLVKTRIPPVDDEYEYEICEGGVRLNTYHGKDREVFIPSEYPPFSGRRVVELGCGTFDRDMPVRTVHVPDTVRKIDWDTFSCARKILDIYIPSSVEDVPYYGIVSRRIHCVKDSAAYRAALKHNEDYLEEAEPHVRFGLDQHFPFHPGEKGMVVTVIDETLDTGRKETAEPYAYLSFSEKRRSGYQPLIDALERKKCYIRLPAGKEDGDALRKGCACLIALADPDYVRSGKIDELREAVRAGKKTAVYVTEECEMPEDLACLQDQHQLRYNTGSEKERITKLANWLADNGCRDPNYIEDFEYSVTEKGILLTDYQGEDSEITVREAYGGTPVISVETSFREKAFIRSLILPDTVREISSRAFYGCSGLERIRLPETLPALGEGAFIRCESLKQVTLPRGLVEIENKTFMQCASLAAVDLPEELRAVGNEAFSACASLREIRLGKNVRSIGYRAFYHCDSLEKISIPDSLEEIGRHAFEECGRLAYTRYDNAYYLGNEENPYVVLTGCVPEDISSVRIHENTRVICEYAFRNCENLTELHIPDSVRFIGEQAFERCVRLETIHISAGLKALGISAFYGCSRLREAILPDSLRVIENGVFAECGALEYVRLPERPERVSDSAFKGSPKVRFRKKKWLLF